MPPSNNAQPQPNRDDLLNLFGFIRTLATVPTEKPKQFVDQFCVVTNGGSSRAYIYDTVGLAWKYVALT